MRMRQYKLRTLLIVITLVGPALWMYRTYGERNVWSQYDSAHVNLDMAQGDWVAANEQRLLSGEYKSRERAARQRYFAARDRFVAAQTALDEYYSVDGLVERRIVTVNGQRRLIPYK